MRLREHQCNDIAQTGRNRRNLRRIAEPAHCFITALETYTKHPAVSLAAEHLFGKLMLRMAFQTRIQHFRNLRTLLEPICKLHRRFALAIVANMECMNAAKSEPRIKRADMLAKVIHNIAGTIHILLRPGHYTAQRIAMTDKVFRA